MFSSDDNTAKNPVRTVGPVQTMEETSAPIPCYSQRVSKLAWITVVTSLLFAMFLFALDNVIVADIQPNIIETVGEVDKLPWVSVGYALGAASLSLSASKLFASFNQKHLFISGVVIFEIGSAICGAAPNMTALILGRVICGPGAVAIYMGINNLLCIMTTQTERPMYMGLVGITWGLGTILGPLIGGGFTDGPATWRWSFYLNLCVGGLMAPVYLFMLPSYNPRPNVAFWKRVAEIDWLGTILHAGAYATVIMAISFGGSVYAWTSSQTIALFVSSGVLWIVFALQQRFLIFTSRDNRIVPFEIVTKWEMQILFALIAAGTTITYIPMYFIPIYYQFVQNTNALGAAVHLVPFAVVNVVATVTNGAMMAEFGYYFPWYLAGGILSTVGGSLLFTTVTTSTGSAAMYGYSVLCGLGAGLFTQAGLAVAQAKVADNAVPHALALIGCGQITGVTFALSISSSVFLNLATSSISAILPGVPHQSIQQAIQGVDSSLLVTLDTSTRADVLEAIVRSINHVYAMVIAAGALTIVLALLMRHEKLFQGQVQPVRSELDLVDKEERACSTFVQN